MKKLLPILAVLIISAAAGAWYYTTVMPGKLQPNSNNTTSSASINGKCVPGITNISPNLYSKVEKKIGAQNPSYVMGGVYPNAIFSCRLNDGTWVASITYDDKSEGNSSPSHFKVVRFSDSGDILDVSPQNKDASIGGQFVVEDVTNNELRFTSHVVDPCYDAVHKYSFNLKTKKYSEVSKGGDDAECWKKLNANGGV